MSEVDRARRARERGDGRTWRERALDAEREADELRAALEKIAGDRNAYAPCLPGCVEGPPTCDCAEETARAALAGVLSDLAIIEGRG